MPKPVYRIVMVICVAAFTLVACNSKKKEEKDSRKDSIQPVDTITQKPTAPGDKMAPTVDTVKQKPTAPGD